MIHKLWTITIEPLFLYVISFQTLFAAAASVWSDSQSSQPTVLQRAYDYGLQRAPCLFPLVQSLCYAIFTIHTLFSKYCNLKHTSKRSPISIWTEKFNKLNGSNFSAVKVTLISKSFRRKTQIKIQLIFSFAINQRIWQQKQAVLTSCSKLCNETWSRSNAITENCGIWLFSISKGTCDLSLNMAKALELDWASFSNSFVEFAEYSQCSSTCLVIACSYCALGQGWPLFFPLYNKIFEKRLLHRHNPQFGQANWCN